MNQDFLSQFNSAAKGSPHVAPLDSSADTNPADEALRSHEPRSRRRESESFDPGQDTKRHNHNLRTKSSRRSRRRKTESSNENTAPKTLDTKAATDSSINSPESKTSALKMTDIPESERPRERMRDVGPSGLQNEELIAIILRSGTRKVNAKNFAQELIAKYDGLSMLSRAGWGELHSLHGIKDAKAAQLLAAFELGRRAESAKEESIGKDCSDPASIAAIMTPLLRDKTREEMWVVLLDIRNRYRGKVQLYTGCSDKMLAKTGEILGIVVERKLPRFAIVHNHPSGVGSPSISDITFTKQLIEASRILEVEMVDHIIIGQDNDNWRSIRLDKLVEFD